MYSYGSSARVGVGKRSHGGRNYRPPKPKNKDSSKLVPPPLKECRCLVEIDVPEYAAVAGWGTFAPELHEGQPPRRLHLCFEGSTLEERRKSLRTTEQCLRSGFGVHLVVPGRNQTGPLAVVGKSHREAIPAVDYLVRRLVSRNNSSSNNNVNSNNNNNNNDTAPFFWNGRITRNVKDQNDDAVLSGRFRRVSPRIHPMRQHEDDDIHLQPYWLFEGASWNIMVCPLALPSERNESAAVALPSTPATEGERTPALSPTLTPPVSHPEQPRQTEEQQQRAAVQEALQVGIDNLRFRLGNTALSELDIFVHPPHSLENATPPKVFACGNPSQRGNEVACIRDLYREIQQTRVVLPAAVAVAVIPTPTHYCA